MLTRARGGASGAATSLEAGSIIASNAEAWLLLEPIGGGGFGAIWKALPMHTVAATSRSELAGFIPSKLGIYSSPPKLAAQLAELAATETVQALKTLHLDPSHSFYSEMVQRLMQEAALYGKLARVRQLPRLIAASRAPLPFFVMELIYGATLTEYVTGLLEEKGVVPWWAISNLFGDILDVVEALHTRGCVHRDLKPENFMLAATDMSWRKILMLIDLGLVKVLAGETIDQTPGADRIMLSTTASPIMVTTAFGAPEQYAPPGTHGVITPATDIYAMGGILYWLASGGNTFLPTTEDFREALEAMKQAVPEIVHPDFRRGAGTALHSLIASMLHVQPAARPQSIAEVRRAFNNVRQAQRAP